jgi:hypothetical protein
MLNTNTIDLAAARCTIILCVLIAGLLIVTDIYNQANSIALARRLLLSASRPGHRPGSSEEAKLINSIRRHDNADVTHPEGRSLAEDAGDLQRCQSSYGDFLPGIHEDLLPWESHGVTKEMLDHAYQHETFHGGFAGMPIIFKDGVPHTIAKTSIGQPGRTGLPMW